jgi:hypothetical protein
MSIAKDAEPLRTKTYENPHNLVFTPATDIHDVKSLLKKIQGLEINELYSIYNFIKAELDPYFQERFTETHLASVINILSREDLEDGYALSAPIPFDVDQKLVLNELKTAALIVEDYKIHHHRVTRLYEQFNAAGKNKSTSVLNSLRLMYAKFSANFSGDQLFYKVVEEAVEKVRSSANFIEMPVDELEQYVNVLAVDAFIRCKIFKNPSEFVNAAA